MPRGLRAYCCRKLVLNLRSKVSQLWIGLALFSILCITLQISGVLQQTRCDQELKRLLVHHISGIQNSILTQKRSLSGPLPDDEEHHKSHKPTLNPHDSEDQMNVMELRHEFIISNLLVNNLEEQDVPDRGIALGQSKDEWILRTDNVLPAKPQGPKTKYPRDSVTASRASSLGQGEGNYTNSFEELKTTMRQKLVERNRTSPSKKNKEPSHGELEVWFSSPNKKFNSSKKGTMESSLPTHKTMQPEAAKDVSKGNYAPTVDLRWIDKQKSQDKHPTTMTSDHHGEANVTQSLLSDVSSSSLDMACKPHTNIVFLKIHKSASSTVMNILFRFGEAHNLTFALPFASAAQLFYPHYFMHEFVEGFSPGKVSQFNIMCHHMRFLLPEVEKVMPYDTFYFAILRNPVQLMESSFAYYKATSAFFKARTLEEFLAEPSHFYNRNTDDSHYAKNLMTFDFGFNNNGNSSSVYVQLNIKAIEAIFNLVLIAEYFDESMILLKEALCWSLDDVVSFPLNSRDDKARLSLSENVTEQIKSWNKLDWELYHYFNRTFWDKIDKGLGKERMQQEVAELRQRREQLAKTCLQASSKVDPKSIKDKSLVPLQYGLAKILGYNLKGGLSKEKSQLCESLIRPELQYSSLLYKRQFPERAKALQNTKRPLKQIANNNPSNRGMEQHERFRRGVH